MKSAAEDLMILMITKLLTTVFLRFLYNVSIFVNYGVLASIGEIRP